MHGAPALPAGFFSVDALYSFLVFPFIIFFFFPAHHRVQAMSRAFIYIYISTQRKMLPLYGPLCLAYGRQVDPETSS